MRKFLALFAACTLPRGVHGAAEVLEALWPSLGIFSNAAFTGNFSNVLDAPNFTDSICALIGVPGAGSFPGAVTTRASLPKSSYTSLWPVLQLLHPFAFSGSYADLTSGKPNVSATVARFVTSTGTSKINEASTNTTVPANYDTVVALYPHLQVFARVAFTGNYNDLTGTPNLYTLYVQCLAQTTTTTITTTTTQERCTADCQLDCTDTSPKCACYKRFKILSCYNQYTVCYNDACF